MADDKAKDVEKKVKEELKKEADKVKTDPDALAKIRKRTGAGREGNGGGKKRGKK